MAPTLNDAQAIAWGALAGLVVLLAAWGPTHALRTWWGVLLFAGLLALGLIALRRQTLKEFPTESAEPETVAPASDPKPRPRRQEADAYQSLRTAK